MQALQRLVAVGQQGQLAVALGQQGREAGDAQVLDPAEISVGQATGFATGKRLGEHGAVETGLLGQLDQLRRRGDIAAVLVERALDRGQQRPDALGVQLAGADQGAAGRLGVVDETVRHGAFETERLPGGVGHGLPML
ncbi:hypothetical protein D3C76_1366800 [compost metagenome]